MGKITTIKIQPQTRERLARMGRKNITYDKIINKVLDYWESHHPGQLVE